MIRIPTVGRLLAGLPACFLATGAHALAWNDPLSTDSLAAPPPFVATAVADGMQPCSGVFDGTRPLGLLDVVDAALCANPQTREAWANARAQAATVGAAESAYLPTLDVAASDGRVRSNGNRLNQRSLGASADWLLFDFGGRAAALDNARQLLEAANATQDATVQSVFAAAVQAYYQVIASTAVQAAAEQSEKSALESYRAAEARRKAGAATVADQLQAQTAHSQATLARIQAEGSARAARGTLANVLGLPANRALQLAPAPQVPVPGEFGQDIDVLLERAAQRRPELKAAEAQARAAQANVGVVRAAGLPRLSLGVSSTDQHTQGLPDNRSGSVGVTLNIPLFSGFDTVYRTRAAQARAEAQAAQAEQVRLQVALDVWNAAQSLRTALQSLRSSGDLLDSAEQSERVARGRYQAGVGSILDLLNAQSALAAARQQRVQSLYDWNVARVALARAVGTLDRDTVANMQKENSQ